MLACVRCSHAGLPLNRPTNYLLTVTLNRTLIQIKAAVEAEHLCAGFSYPSMRLMQDERKKIHTPALISYVAKIYFDADQVDRSGGVVGKCDCSILLGPQRTHSRSGSGLLSLSSADRLAFRTHASFAPCRSASSSPARWPSSGLAPAQMLCKQKTLQPKSAK